MFRPLGKKQLLLAGLLLAGLGATLWYSAHYAELSAVTELRDTADNRLLLYESTFHSALNRYQYLPYILATNQEILQLLERGGDPLRINGYLEAVNAEAGPASIYIMNPQGVTVASSNWRTPQSYVGHDFSFRPYFRDAMKGSRGIFYGLGVNTKLPGFFFSCPISQDNRLIGAAVVKVELKRLQKEWREGGETVFVTDQNGVIVLATREEWVYRSLTPHGQEALARIQSQEQYRGVSLSVLPALPTQRAGMTELAMGPERFLMGSRPLDHLGWHIHYLAPAHFVDEQIRGVSIIAVAAFALLVLLGLLARANHQRKVSRQKAIEAKRIHQINQQLEAEIAERRRKEQELRETHDELIHAGQMAALGQMAASVAHELNQPLAAIRMFSANCRVMLQRGQTGPVLDNLGTIHDLTGRLAAVASQLKSFSRKSPSQKERMDLRRSMDNALALLRHQAETMGCQIQMTQPDDPLMVRGIPMHMDQVFVNLLQNSLDAMREAPAKVVRILLRQSLGHAEAVIQDSGPGLAPEAQERLFSPFFTTKEPGHGLGLGLSIIHGIIRDMNGEIRGENLEGGGACFTVRLPLFKDA
ncbi:MAG: sensor histidine kinase [Desulfarculus sp.]|nr:sensor histidine kinase [Desulfarculus sp.]